MPTRSTDIEREIEAIACIPRNCVCTWSWSADKHQWVKTRAEQNCPWHKAANPL